MLKKFVIDYDPYRCEGERYNVQEWRSFQDEEDDPWDGCWCYAGYGRFCKTLAEAEAWAASRVPDGQKPVIEHEGC